MPTTAARELNARQRARSQRIHTFVVVPGRHYRTSSRTTRESYELTHSSQGWTCPCLGYQHTGCCKHLGAVERRSEREGWPFGRLARPEASLIDPEIRRQALAILTGGRLGAEGSGR